MYQDWGKLQFLVELKMTSDYQIMSVLTIQRVYGKRCNAKDLEESESHTNQQEERPLRCTEL